MCKVSGISSEACNRAVVRAIGKNCKMRFTSENNSTNTIATICTLYFARNSCRESRDSIF